MANVIIQKYPSPDYPLYVSMEERKSGSAPDADAVRLEDIEVLIVNNGSLSVHIKNKTYTAYAGQGVVIRCGVERNVSYAESENTAFYRLVFHPRLMLGPIEHNSLKAKYYDALFDNPFYECFLLDKSYLANERSLERLGDVVVANMVKRPGYEMYSKGYLCLLWATMLEASMTRQNRYNGMNVPSRDALRVRAAKEYIDESYAEPLTLEDIATMIHVSRNECCRCFKRVIGISPIDYLIKRRVYEAATVLYKEPLKVDSMAELGFNTGFNTISYFNRMFKKYMNCTPTEYATMLKNDTEKARQIYRSIENMVDV